MIYRITKNLAAFLLRLCFKIEIKGRDVIPKDQPFILAANHISNLDPVVLGAFSPVHLFYLAKEELFVNKFFGFYLILLC